MRFRSHFLKADGNSIPGGGLCGKVPLRDTSLAVNLQVQIKVDDVVILQTDDFSTFTTAIVPVNSMVVTITKINGVGFRIDIPLVNVWDSATVTVAASKANYANYANGFVVFGYDLGNDQNDTNGVGDSIIYNPDMDIMMMRDWSGQPTQAGNAYSKFVAYRRPFTDRIYFFDLVSQPQKYSYTLVGSATVIGTSRNGSVCSSNAVDVVQNVKVGHLNPVCEFIVDDSCNSIQTVEDYSAMKMPFELAKDCVDCNQDCISFGETFSAITLINNNPDFQTFWQDDASVPPYLSMRLNYELKDLNGVTIKEQEYIIPITVPFIPDPNSYPFEGLSLAQSGDFIVIVTMSVDGLFECKKSITLEGCTGFEFEQLECGKYRFINKTLGNLSYLIYKVTSDMIATQELPDDPYLQATVAPNEEGVIVLVDGLYAVTYGDANGSNLEYLTVHCDIDACFTRFMKSLVCSTKKPCGDCGDGCKKCGQKKAQKTYNFNAMISMWYILIGTLSNNVLLNKIFTSQQLADNPDLISELLSDVPVDAFSLANLDDYFNKIKEYCVNCSIGLDETDGCPDCK